MTDTAGPHDRITIDELLKTEDIDADIQDNRDESFRLTDEDIHVGARIFDSLGEPFEIVGEDQDWVYIIPEEPAEERVSRSEVLTHFTY